MGTPGHQRLKNNSSVQGTTREIALRLKSADAKFLAMLRTLKGLQICLFENDLWLWAPKANEELIAQLRHVPVIERYDVLDDRQLVVFSRNVPSNVLPDGPWIDLADWLELEAPRTHLPATVNNKINLRLVLSQNETYATGLMTTLETLSNYVEQAPALRIELCRFAMNSMQKVFLTGNPLPPIRGTRYYELSGIWIPAGYEISPRVQADVLRHIFQLDDEKVLIWEDTETVHKLHQTDFTAVTRIAVRTTRLQWSKQ